LAARRAGHHELRAAPDGSLVVTSDWSVERKLPTFIRYSRPPQG
jgi:hypothetical protein